MSDPHELRRTGRALLQQAESAGLLLGVAPDTVLGPGLQTARRLIARGDIGTPLSASTVIQYPGPELFHPSPEFLFAAGAGPLFDVGPYYLTALVHVFGPFARVAAVGSTGHPTRTIQVGDRAGTVFPVDVPTHVNAIAQFTDGGIAQSVFSFDSPLARAGVVEISGTEGTMAVPDPNNFDGDVRITGAATVENLAKDPEWVTIPASGVVAGRGTGVLDLARCLRNGGRPMASGELAFHVLDAMIAMDEAMTRGEIGHRREHGRPGRRGGRGLGPLRGDALEHRRHDHQGMAVPPAEPQSPRPAGLAEPGGVTMTSLVAPPAGVVSPLTYRVPGLSRGGRFNCG